MHSSTSSFKNVFLITAIAITIYSMALRFVGPVTTGQAQAQENKIHLENFVFENQICTKVIAGSSLSYRLLPENLGADYCNLAFAGSSAVSGLAVLKKRLPPTVKDIFVEVNVLRDLDDDLYSSVDGINYQVKRNFPFLQSRYQPVTILLNFLRGLTPRTPPVPTNEQFLFWLNLHKAEFSEVSGDFQRGFDVTLTILRNQIRDLETQEAHVHLIELPMHPSLLESAKNIYQRQKLVEFFPEMTLLQDSSRQYMTDDALHLDMVSAQRFAEFLRGKNL